MKVIPPEILEKMKNLPVPTKEELEELLEKFGIEV